MMTTRNTNKKLNRTTTKSAAPSKTAKTAATVAPETFAPGQKWQFGIGYAEIVHVGKILIDYRFHTAPNQKRVPITTDILSQFAQNLKKQKAKLIS
jgi:hypothetical protein